MASLRQARLEPRTGFDQSLCDRLRDKFRSGGDRRAGLFHAGGELGKDWASGTLGTTAALGRGMTAYATFNTQMGQGNVTTYGGQLGLNVALNAPSVDPVRARY